MSRDFVSGIYKSELDARNQPQGNFADEINKTVNDAQARRHRNNRRKQYGSYSSKGAQGSPETRRLTNRITGEKDD